MLVCFRSLGACVSIVNAYSPFNYLHFYIAGPLFPKNRLERSLGHRRVNLVTEWHIHKSTQNTHTQGITALDGETQIASSPPPIEALKSLQGISQRASRRKKEKKGWWHGSRRLRGLHTIDEEQLVRSKQRLSHLNLSGELHSQYSTLTASESGKKKCLRKANGACILRHSYFV